MPSDLPFGDHDSVVEEVRSYRALLSASRDMVITVDADGRPTFISPAVREVMGYEPEELLRIDPFTRIHPDDRTRMVERFSLVGTAGEEHGPVVVRVEAKDGSWRWLEVLATNLLADDRVEAIVVNARDVTERIEAEQALAAERERYKVLVETIPDIVTRFDPDLHVRYLNPAAERLLGSGSPDDVPVLVEWPQETAEQAVEILRSVVADGESRTYEDQLLINGEVRWFEVAAVPELLPDGTTGGVTAIAHDITEHKITEEELARRALEDPLTGLANRVWFELSLGRSLQGMDRHFGPVAVLFLDLDRFKVINDTRGHPAGDAYLRAVAKRLVNAVRPSDIVARFGGDEFAIQPEGLASREEALTLAERIHESLRDLTLLEDGEVVGSASIGVAFSDTKNRLAPDELLRRADLAMYQAKRDGRGRTAIYTEG